MKRVVNELFKVNCVRWALAVFVLCAVTAVALPAETFTTLHSFDGTGGAYPAAALIQATNGDLYGTLSGNYGSNGYGAVFKVTPGGTLTTLHAFCFPCTDGYAPTGGLVQATNGYLYGTTDYGGAYSSGTIFKVTPSGALTTIYSFCAEGYPCMDGESPTARLVQAANGYLYGTTHGFLGGTAAPYGSVFKMTPSGALTTLHTFCIQSGCPDGEYPNVLIQSANGDLYGTTSSGFLTPSPGTVFKITPSGTLTTLYTFCSLSGCADGSGPVGGLVQATNGNFYGMTSGTGGASYCGAVFKITPSGTLTTLYTFCSQSGDGAYPGAGLVQATDGDFYGTTTEGGANGYGTVFKITPSGALTTLHSFDGTDGEYPNAGLVQDTNGFFYGTTTAGGANGYGTVFSLSVGLGPFVETQTTSGEVGATVNILGSDLTGATSVSFNGIAATFTVVSRSLITATVPAGASTGTMEVVTPSGTLSSNMAFRVP
jgi:uncharacterized repeat protein (TIGR03803 family)